MIESLPVPLAYTSLARSFMMSPNDSGINELAHIKKSASVSGVQLSSEKKNNKNGKNDSIKKKAACPAYAEIELSEKLVTKSKAVTMISHLRLYFLALFPSMLDSLQSPPTALRYSDRESIV